MANIYWFTTTPNYESAMALRFTGKVIHIGINTERSYESTIKLIQFKLKLVIERLHSLAVIAKHYPEAKNT